MRLLSLLWRWLRGEIGDPRGVAGGAADVAARAGAGRAGMGAGVGSGSGVAAGVGGGVSAAASRSAAVGAGVGGGVGGGVGVGAAGGSARAALLDEDDDLDLMEDEGMQGDMARGGSGNGFVEPPMGVGALSQIKNRQEMLSELKKNYSEVLGLVRKVDHHLDLQTRRSERLLEIAEQSLRSMQVLPELVEQNRRVADSIASLARAVESGQERAEEVATRISKTAIQQLESLQMQTSALQQMQGAIVRSGDAELEMAESVRGFRDTLGGVARATTDLGQSITAMRETDAAREGELAKLLDRSQRWLVVAVIVTGLSAIGALVLVLRGVIG